MTSAAVPEPATTSETEVTAERAGPSAGFARRTGAFLLHELGEILPPTIFFFIGFDLIVLNSDLL